jgi:hypothetical protein
MELLRLMKESKETGEQVCSAWLQLARGTPTEELAHCVERSRKGTERSRLTLQGIQRRLAMRDDEVLADEEVSALPRHLRDKTLDELIVMQPKAQQELKRYEDTLRIATTVLTERR